MSTNLAAFAVICCAAALAAWIDIRFPKISPGSFTEVGLHLVCSLFAIELGMRVLGSVPREPAAIMAGFFGAALPATLYLLLAALWLMKLLAGFVYGMSPPGRHR